MEPISKVNRLPAISRTFCAWYYMWPSPLPVLGRLETSYLMRSSHQHTVLAHDERLVQESAGEEELSILQIAEALRICASVIVVEYAKGIQHNLV